MTGKTGLVTVAVAAVLGLSGCTACHHEACAVSLCPAAAPDTCSAQRNRVHIFLVGGVDLTDDGGLKGLRDAINAAGFSQVYYGQSHNCGWFDREIRRIACDDREARFVFVGYGVGSGSVIGLAGDAHRCGLEVVGLVLLDPAGAPADACAPAGTAVHVVGSDRWVPRGDLTGCEVVRLPGVCHFSIATEPQTVERTVGLLREAVSRVPDDAVVVPVMPLIDDPAPIPEVIPDAPAAKPAKPPAKPPAGTLAARPAGR